LGAILGIFSEIYVYICRFLSNEIKFMRFHRVKKAMGRLQIAAVRVYLNSLSAFSEKKAGNITIRLFGSPRKGLLLDADTEFLKSAKWETLQLNGHNIQSYHWAGTGKRLLLAHGWESNSARWKPLIGLLQAQNYDIIAMDAPRHGATGGRYFGAMLYGEMMHVVIQHFKPTILIGHSIGGFTATYCLHRFKKTTPSVSQLILLAAPSNLRHIFEIFLNVVGLNQRVRQGYYAEFKRIAGNTTEEFTAENFCHDLNVKGLIIHDRTDDVAKFEDSAKIHAALKDSEYVITEGYGHRLQDEFIYKKIIEFLTPLNTD
jgi:pimeloyl-ACP methyl ester carboxylesterase